MLSQRVSRPVLDKPARLRCACHYFFWACSNYCRIYHFCRTSHLPFCPGASHTTLVLRPTAFGTSIRCVFSNWINVVKIGDNVKENIVAYKQRTWWGGARISYVAKHTWNFASARRPHSRFFQLHRPHIRPYFLQLPTVAFFVANGNRSRVPQLALGMRFSHVTDAYVS